MRKKIYNILNQNAIYDTFMFTVIFMSIIPLALLNNNLG